MSKMRQPPCCLHSVSLVCRCRPSRARCVTGVSAKLSCRLNSLVTSPAPQGAARSAREVPGGEGAVPTAFTRLHIPPVHSMCECLPHSAGVGGRLQKCVKLARC